MARIKNMGSSTMRFNEGVIVSGSAGQPSGTDSDYALIVSGDIYGDEDLILERNIYLSDSSYTSPTIYFNDANSVYIQEVNNQLIIEPNNFLNLRFDQGLLINAESEDNPIIVFSNYPAAYKLKGALFNFSQDSDQDFSVSTSNQKRAIFVSSSDDTVMFHAEGIPPASGDTSTWFSGSAYDLSAGAFDPSNFGESTGRITQFSGDVITSGAIVGKNNSLSGLTGEENCLILTAQNSIYGTATTYGFYGDTSSLQNIGDDMFFFVSGTIGGRGQSGTSVFGGDVVISGSLDVNNASITTDGKIGIGNTSPNDALDVTGNVRISNYIRLNCQGTVTPPGTPPLQDHAHIYSKLTGGTAEIFVQDSDGNETQISPHNPEGEWHYFSRNTRTGKVVRINMEKMIRRLEEITGESFMEEWYEDPTD